MTYIHVVFHISTESLSFTFMNIYQYLILHKVRRKLYSESLEKILKIHRRSYRMEIVWTFIGNRIDFGYP
jgi:hypothetical protein